jgi:hypothetical protein
MPAMPIKRCEHCGSIDLLRRARADTCDSCGRPWKFAAMGEDDVRDRLYVDNRVTEIVGVPAPPRISWRRRDSTPSLT